MNIEIINAEQLSADNTPLLVASVQRAVHFAGEHTQRTVIFVNVRDSDGWLEFIMQYHVEPERNVRPFTVGCMQRRPDAEFEFHS